MPTVPETEMDLPRDSESEGAPHPLDRPRLTWSVDLGDELKAMTTFELWYALNTGELPPEIRVWRLGREAWSAAREVPELACALRETELILSLDEEIDRVTMDYAERLPGFDEVVWPAPPSALRAAPPPSEEDDRPEIVAEEIVGSDGELAALEAATVTGASPLSDPELPAVLRIDEPFAAAHAATDVPSVTPPSSYVVEIEPAVAETAPPPARRRNVFRRRHVYAVAAAAALALVAFRGSKTSGSVDAHASLAAAPADVVRDAIAAEQRGAEAPVAADDGVTDPTLESADAAGDLCAPDVTSPECAVTLANGLDDANAKRADAAPGADASPRADKAAADKHAADKPKAKKASKQKAQPAKKTVRATEHPSRDPATAGRERKARTGRAR
ncbi:MAG TPA: hypothetical protein VL400_17610 [Polyangiaceae bacterium]|nr:hypothetical protein [Polyangiaceae bacterium]